MNYPLNCQRSSAIFGRQFSHVITVSISFRVFHHLRKGIDSPSRRLQKLAGSGHPTGLEPVTFGSVDYRRDFLSCKCRKESRRQEKGVVLQVVLYELPRIGMKRHKMPHTAAKDISCYSKVIPTLQRKAADGRKDTV
jgi:hypothetical protein